MEAPCKIFIRGSCERGRKFLKSIIQFDAPESHLEIEGQGHAVGRDADDGPDHQPPGSEEWALKILHCTLSRE